MSQLDQPIPSGNEVITRVQGLATVGRRALANGDYRRIGRALYVPAGLDVDHGVRLGAMRLRLGDDPVLVGVSAAWALGCQLAEPEAPVHIMIDSGTGSSVLCRPQRGSVPEREQLRTAFGLATCPGRTAVDLARGLGGTEYSSVNARVAWLDALVRCTSLTADAARKAVEESSPRRGLAVARVVGAAVRDGVDSPRETALRLLVARAGFPEPVVQCLVRDGDGDVIARLDLGWPTRRAGLEYDGSVHREPQQHSRDLARHNRLRTAGWRVLQVDAELLRNSEELVRQTWRLLGGPRRRATSV